MVSSIIDDLLVRLKESSDNLIFSRMAHTQIEQDILDEE